MMVRKFTDHVYCLLLQDCLCDQREQREEEITSRHGHADDSLAVSPSASCSPRLLAEQKAVVAALQTELRTAQDLVAVQTSEARALHSRIDSLEVDLVQARSCVNNQQQLERVPDGGLASPAVQEASVLELRSELAKAQDLFFSTEIELGATPSLHCCC